MSVIKVATAPSIVDAVALKLANASISPKTVDKLERCAARLYGIGNCDVSDPAFKGLRAGVGEVEQAQARVEGMADGEAKSVLAATLQSITTRIREEIGRQEAYFGPQELPLLRHTLPLAVTLLEGHRQSNRAPDYVAPPTYAEADTTGIENTRL